MEESPFPGKAFLLWLLLISATFLSAFLGLIFFTSLSVALTNLYQLGAWVPGSVGGIGLMVTLLLYYRVLRAILTRLKRRDPLHL